MIGEFIGELNASHTYHGGGDMERGAAAVGRHARRGLGAGERRVPDQAHHPRRSVGLGDAARRSTSPA